MATILLSVAGAAIGGSIGGTFLGLSAVAAGRFVGATLGRAIDARLMGQGSATVKRGQVDRFRLTGAGEGAAIAHAYGRLRVPGHVIWATEFTEKVKTSGGGGKGAAPAEPEVKTYSYSVSLAIALGEGEITGVHRVWADGAEVSPDDLNMRVYHGTDDQLPDPKIEAVEGAGTVPAYRGTAYVVMEDLSLTQFGNRIPQFNFEITRPVAEDAESADGSMARGIRAVAMMPGSGEYALATEQVHIKYGKGSSASANVNTPSGLTDFETSLQQLDQEVPNCEAASLIVSWFGSDLRCGSCEIKPKVEQAQFDGKKMPWRVAGLTRTTAEVVPELDGRPVYGGTPTDQSVVQAIRALGEAGKAVTYYPFILMDQMAGNTLPDPYSGEDGQPALPWRGRITTSLAPGVDGSVDGSAAAAAEVDAFFGTASATDFAVAGDAVVYSGPVEWGFRRYILHQAALCAAAGGVDAFCIGSEMRGLTQIRGAGNTFPAVAALRALAAECRALLGPGVKIGYAADWSEYFGYHPQDGSGDVLFHLDPLWADEEIDFIGIDNYMPLSDWRDGPDHLDVAWGDVSNVDYLRANIEGGEGYDWYYAGPQARDVQDRTPITDGAHDEPWVYRYKDVRNWWLNPHHNRIGGVREAVPTDWQPQSKPVWFTEYGCAAVDKGTNQPNKFLDPKSSESSLPHYSTGARDDYIQAQYLRAVMTYWGDPERNPVSEVYGAEMLDMSRAFVWAWDARPFPWFPSLSEEWSDGENYHRGHWITGRVSFRTLADVVREICARAGLVEIDVSDLRGIVRGYTIDDVSDARAALQPLMLRYGFDAIERDGLLVFQMRDGRPAVQVPADDLAEPEGDGATIEAARGSDIELMGRVRVKFFEAEGDYAVISEEAVLAEDRTHNVSESEFPLVLTRAEGRQVAERWLTEARVARDTLRFRLPPSRMDVAAGDVVEVAGAPEAARYRVDRVEVGAGQALEAVRIEPTVYTPSDIDGADPVLAAFVPAIPVLPVFMDLPLISGDEVPHAPHLAVTSLPWPGTVAVYRSSTGADYALDEIVAAPSAIGETETPMFSARSGVIDRGAPLRVSLTQGEVQGITDAALLAGGNLAAIGDGSTGNWELFQFRDVLPLGDGRFELTHRLRGQAGSDGIMPPVWPAGSQIVLLDGTPQQIGLSLNQRRIAQHFRIGPARRPIDDPTYEEVVEAFDGNGLRPYSPAHLAAAPDGGDLVLSWIRRTRIAGDAWDAPEVPLGEESERYLVQVFEAGNLLREEQVSAPDWTYTAAAQVEDGGPAVFEVAVAQISAIYGAGPAARLAWGA
ncbi:baseplate multidomain protein megatron [Pseudaestuariivita atlantica]|uniref:Phage host specificity protein n=1 Tax=Pseudaestuariivita atlantica TaxID=1317121 RepID=A0A0L1JLY6_9RHOB|nr:glycoside hydrolase TIM-barrel-like domain-containing protein [Pseudaestuariivita atlantica]KNG92769.1 phage host specificity protein [Pseudaestuariivita atlantica]